MIKALMQSFLPLITLLMINCTGFATVDAAPVKTALYSEYEVVEPGETVTLLVEVDLAPSWHLYWKNPGDSGMAPSFDWQLPEGIAITKVLWSVPKRFETEGLITFGYEERAKFLIDLEISKEFKGEAVDLKGDLTWIVCSSDTCLPGSSPLEAHLLLGPSQKSASADKISAERALFPKKVAIQAHSEGNLLHLTLNEAVKTSEKTAFFPEEPLPLDHEKGVLLEKGEEGHIATLTLAAAPTQEARLKGVLVVGSEAFELDHPLALSEELIAEAPKLQKPLNPETEHSEESLGFVTAILFAFLGGLLLNLMPCVLPVVSLKVMSFVKMGDASRSETAKHGLYFTAGVLLSFFVLAALLITLQMMGRAVGWGFQLQDPFFIALMTLLFLLLSLNLFGVFEIGTSVAGLAGSAVSNSKEGASKSFVSGVFATAVATPCTGPFMGSALGYAIAQPAYVSFAIFGMLGLGMALPYLLIGFYPSLIRFLPKPGAWMESFKQFLGFLMLCTVLWLLWVFTGQTTETALFTLLFALLITSVGAWVYGRFGNLSQTKSVRKISFAISAICLTAALIITWKSVQLSAHAPHEKIADAGWEPFSAERLAKLRAEGVPVLIDFTAKWCLVCQANHLVLSKGNVEQKISEKGVVKMKADWTRYDPAITNELKKHGRTGVPLYVLYGDEEKPKILPQLLTPNTLISSIDEGVKNNVR